MKIYVINLERDTQRRTKMLEQLNRIGWSQIEIVSAVDGRTLPSQMLRKPVFNRHWVDNMRGTIGCFLSHLSAWEKIAASGDSAGIVVEDDIRIGDLHRLRTLILPAGTDIVYINDRMCLGRIDTGTLTMHPMIDALRKLDKARLAGGGDGYLITADAARKLTETCDRDGIFGHVDGRLLRYATNETTLDELGPGTWIADVIRNHHNPGLKPALGILNGYVLGTPLVRHGSEPSSRENTDIVSQAPATIPISLGRSSERPVTAHQSDRGVPIRYWNRIRNVGDCANPYVIEQIGGAKPVYTVDDRQPHVLGIGSIFFMATSESRIWGSGILDPRDSLENIDVSNVHAVRGKLTLEKLRRERGLAKDVSLGDPGIFVDELPSIKKLQAKTSKRFRYAIIPHHNMFSNEYYRTLSRNDEVLILDPRLELNDFIEGILSAEQVVSQSLHGMIFAEVLGIPYTWVAHSADEIWLFKFRDWFSTTADPDRTPSPFGLPIEKLSGQARLSGSQIQREHLRRAFPGNLSCDRRAIYDFRETIALEPLVLIADSRGASGDFAFKTRKLRVSYGDGEALRLELNQIAGCYEISAGAIIVFEGTLFNRISVQALNTALRMLDHFVDRHYVLLLDRSHLNVGQDKLKDYEGMQYVEIGGHQHRWNGVAVARHVINFSFETPSLIAVI